MTHGKPISSTENPVSADVEAVEAAAATSVRSPTSVSVILTFAVLGVLGALAGTALVNSTDHTFAVELPAELSQTQGIFTPEQLETIRAQELAADYRNLPLAIGLLGMAVAASIGIARGIVRRSPMETVTGAVTGAIAGLLAGALGAVCAVFIRHLLRNWNLIADSGEADHFRVQLHTMAIQLPSWLAIAAAATLAACSLSAVGRRAILPTLGAAVAAVLLAMLIYPIAASLVFPNSDPDMVIPMGTGNRFLWATMTAAIMGLLIGRQAGTTPARTV